MVTFTASSVSGQTGTIQTYTIPDTGTYFIRAYGAQGGGSNGGLGARVSGLFPFTVGDELLIVVGQRPVGDTGGGGGSFVALDNGGGVSTSTPLLVAAGGGGSTPGFARAAFMDGQVPGPLDTAIDGRGGDNQGSPGGTGGDGGGPTPSVASVVGSGGGFSTDGDDGTNSSAVPVADTGGSAFVNGADGGDPFGAVSAGGFGGGGGGASVTAGGGGGYNGGGGARFVNAVRSAGGGGGSYNIGESREGESGYRTGEGEVFIQIIAQPQPPANITTTVNGTEVEVCWEDPDETNVWADKSNVYTEIRRTDCNGTTHIANVPPDDTTLTGCFTDRFAPLSRTGVGCDAEGHECELTYELRYVGLVQGVADLPALVPTGFIVGWDGPLAEIPSGWSRTTTLDGRYPRGASSSTSGATGGASTHSHTTPGHSHTISAHRHPMPAGTSATNSTVPTTRVDTFSSRGLVNHAHTFESNQTGNAAGGTSGSASPSTNSANHEPPSYSVAFIESDGTPTQIPVGAIVWAAANITGYTTMAGSFTNRVLKGAATSTQGGAFAGSATHSHAVAAHTHTGLGSHTHTVPPTRQQNLVDGRRASYAGSTTMAGTFAGSFSGSSSDLRHIHNVTAGNANIGNLNSGSGGTTSSFDNRPPTRDLRLLRSVSGAVAIGLIGLWQGDSTSLPGTLRRCDGASGTPDLRSRFPRATTAGSATGGATNHTHTTPSHGHTITGHTHTLTVGQPTQSEQVRTSSPTNDVSTGIHTHTAANVGTNAPTVTGSGSGTTNSVAILPPFTDVHYVRIESTSTSPLNEEVVQETEWTTGVAEVDAPDSGMTLVKHPVLDLELTTCPDVNWSRGRPFQVAQPLAGGMPTVLTGDVGGRDYSLTFAVTSETDANTLETILAAPLFWMQPAVGPAGWFAAAPWGVEQLKMRRKVHIITVTVTEVLPEPLPAASDLI